MNGKGDLGAGAMFRGAGAFRAAPWRASDGASG